MIILGAFTRFVFVEGTRKRYLHMGLVRTMPVLSGLESAVYCDQEKRDTSPLGPYIALSGC
jgi:hypothetical protein